MKRLNIMLFLPIALLVMCAQGVSQWPPKAKIANIQGTIVGSTYTNDYFGLSLTIPKGWIVFDAETSAAVTKIGSDAVKGRDEKDNKAVEESINRTVKLLTFSKRPVGASENAAFVLTASRQVSSAVTAAMVAEATKSALDSSPTLRLTADAREKLIGRRKFVLLDYELNINGQRAVSKFFVTMVQEYAISFSLSYVEASDLSALERVVESIQFSVK